MTDIIDLSRKVITDIGDPAPIGIAADFLEDRGMAQDSRLIRKSLDSGNIYLAGYGVVMCCSDRPKRDCERYVKKAICREWKIADPLKGKSIGFWVSGECTAFALGNDGSIKAFGFDRCVRMVRANFFVGSFFVFPKLFSGNGNGFGLPIRLPTVREHRNYLMNINRRSWRSAGMAFANAWGLPGK